MVNNKQWDTHNGVQPTMEYNTQLCNMHMHLCVCVCVCVHDSTPIMCVQIFTLLFSCNILSKKYAANVDGNINM
jgi:hypothetical protein